MKKRLDVLLTEKGFFQSREKAKASIMAGLVFVDGVRFDKAGMPVDENAPIEVRGNDCPYVSRGGYKLEKALDYFGLDVNGSVCMDIGASTGGFTDCMLQRGAKKVYSIDVGYNQLDYKLRVDPRVVCMEKCNFRYLDPATIEDEIDFACGDVSFISLKHMFPVVSQLLKEGAYGAFLIKPQFEAGREQVGKHGIVKDPRIHKEVIEKVIGYANENGFAVRNLSYSPIKGTTGNIEFLALLQLGAEQEDLSELIDSVVAEAHSGLDVKEEA